MQADPLQIFQESDQSLFEKMAQVRDLAFQAGEMPVKNKLLIALAIDAAKNAEKGVRALAEMALASGATKKEIMETLRVVYHICGVGSIYSAAAALKDIL